MNHEDHEGHEGFGWFTAETLRSQRRGIEIKNLCVLRASAVNPAFSTFDCCILGSFVVNYLAT
jgi:hypothetical protein